MTLGESGSDRKLPGTSDQDNQVFLSSRLFSTTRWAHGGVSARSTAGCLPGFGEGEK